MSHVIISRRIAANLVGGLDRLADLVRQHGAGYSGELVAFAGGTRLVVQNHGKRTVFGVYGYSYGDNVMDVLSTVGTAYRDASANA